MESGFGGGSDFVLTVLHAVKEEGVAEGAEVVEVAMDEQLIVSSEYAFVATQDENADNNAKLILLSKEGDRSDK